VTSLRPRRRRVCPRQPSESNVAVGKFITIDTFGSIVVIATAGRCDSSRDRPFCAIGGLIGLGDGGAGAVLGRMVGRHKQHSQQDRRCRYSCYRFRNRTAMLLQGPLSVEVTFRGVRPQLWRSTPRALGVEQLFLEVIPCIGSSRAPETQHSLGRAG
jgi:hypothetical protein